MLYSTFAKLLSLPKLWQKSRRMSLLLFSLNVRQLEIFDISEREGVYCDNKAHRYYSGQRNRSV